MSLRDLVFGPECHKCENYYCRDNTFSPFSTPHARPGQRAVYNVKTKVAVLRLSEFVRQCPVNVVDSEGKAKATPEQTALIIENMINRSKGQIPEATNISNYPF